MQEVTSRTIVVGIDGSKAAFRAALWAVDEAVSRDIPLRLLGAVERGDRLASAWRALRYASTAVEATNKPVKIELDVIQGDPADTLVRASSAAAMVCVGAVGFKHFQPGRMGSTAATLAASAHCPVAIVRGRGEGDDSRNEWIVVDLDASPDNGVVLQAGVDEAILRTAPLRVIGCWKSAADGDRRVHAQLERRLSRWTQSHPGLRVETLAVHGSSVDYLRNNAPSVQLVVTGARDPHRVAQLVGPTGNAALRDGDCSVLVVDRRHL
jgi:nucleotide-binding universal stress UspA family protein